MDNHKVLFSYYKKYKGGWLNSEGEDIPSIREDMVLFKLPYSTDGGNLSHEINNSVQAWYQKYKNKGMDLGIRGKLHPDYIFRILPMNIGEKTEEPMWNGGTFSAVYLIDDVNKIIKDSTLDGEFILKLTARKVKNFMITTNHMYDTNKVKNDYKIYNAYLPSIYFHGVINERVANSNPLNLFHEIHPLAIESINSITDYVITRKYHSLPEKSSEFKAKYPCLGNARKLKFLLSNIQMLRDLYNNNSFCSDYKPTNIGWDNMFSMNVILLDYDPQSIIDIDDNRNFEITRDSDNNIESYNIKFPFTSFFVPAYLKTGSSKKFVSDVTDKALYKKWDIGGLSELIKYLDIEFLNVKHPERNGIKFSEFGIVFNIYNPTESLHLEDDDDDNIPSYDVLYSIFKYLLDNHCYQKLDNQCHKKLHEVVDY